MIKKLLSRITAFVALVLCIGFSAKAAEISSAVEVTYSDGAIAYTDENLSNLPTGRRDSDIICYNILVKPDLGNNDIFTIGGSTLHLRNTLSKIKSIYDTVINRNRHCIIRLALSDDMLTTEDNFAKYSVKFILLYILIINKYRDIGLLYYISEAILEKCQSYEDSLKEIFYANFLVGLQLFFPIGEDENLCRDRNADIFISNSIERLILGIDLNMRRDVDPIMSLLLRLIY